VLFNSWPFIFVFLPITFCCYFGLTRLRLIMAAKVWLVAASLAFYAYWDISYLALILGSLLFNFAVGSSLSQTHPDKIEGIGPSVVRVKNRLNRKTILTVGIAANLGLLGYFKYAGFLVENLNHALDLNYPLPDILLPLAISFFTFQQIAYLVDSYRGETSEYNLLNYSIFVTFFPQLIAGPIVHHREMMKQFNSPRSWFINHSHIAMGLFIFSIGLFKKVVIADTFAVWADQGFDGNHELDFFAAWGASLAYTFQLYFDFSGYCDMAMGIAYLFNIRLPVNFNSPYKALNIQDFWRRWHITLSRFLRNYIYIPLGGNRQSEWHTCCNLMATFLLGGLWHGASWMFVIWGALHGFALIIHRFWQKTRIKMPFLMAWLLTFLFINVSWVFFRAVHMDDAMRVLTGMLDVSSITNTPLLSIPTSNLAWGGWLSDILLAWMPVNLFAQLLPCLAFVVAFIIITRQNSVEMTMAPYSTRKVVFSAVSFVFAAYTMLAATSTVFLYFNF